ncbi:hypothetical protein OC835_000237 [Tilletia horrida]|uniref:NADH dehydrogenase [ubiquinone] iron-sulfur protein 5 n=1 Tax=Tilletia horrida TaxID=155126 RepID=A0AAN6JHJ9_9BASI|nr:hypothetical protein OC842_006568 [Tilletia horrida]KAK0541376.1 hypothetical protein OC835_000237 [Tilletia horrida]KAK0566145.1 hypothetical protein OC844_000889 [Tilletia horrida]
MASGFGYSGNQSRCFQFFQEFRKCYASADMPGQCAAQQADYFECLHHTKEIARNKAIKEHLIERAAKEIKEARSRGELSASGNPLRLNLIVTEDESKKQAKQEEKEKENRPAGKDAKEEGSKNGAAASSSSEDA